MGQLVEFCSGQVHIQMLRALSGCSDERQVDVGGGCGRKLLLCLLCGLFQSLHCHLIAGQVYALSLLELVNQPLGNAVIEIITA